MFKQILAMAAFVSMAQAHLDLGKYIGTTEDLKACEIEILSIEFLNNQRHPLNERVLVQIGAEKLYLQHQAIIDANKATAKPDSDGLSSVQATATGAKLWYLKMIHSEEFTGPNELLVADHNYRQENLSTKKLCKNLKLQK